MSERFATAKNNVLEALKNLTESNRIDSSEAAQKAALRTMIENTIDELEELISTWCRMNHKTARDVSTDLPGLQNFAEWADRNSLTSHVMSDFKNTRISIDDTDHLAGLLAHCVLVRSELLVELRDAPKHGDHNN